ncbi:2-iminobutanoate/2-iminopropanoate deaminase [Pseudocercospora fuligena]|uniref:2-iminobutanoate/2-iminopropanoate deaminase n=1 Tax=Pseudocercospora fuligena TaxID=685502 RepID=A0A8H6R5V9_9PEZI|nr:2-iminobutanoate/2-iminopropanoate deaminase [Pseudocercospora fuligena]
MSHLTYFSPAFNAHYSQAVRKGSEIIVSGQPGLNRITRVIPTDLKEEVEQAFANIDQFVREAGGKGMSQVYKLTFYATSLDAETMGAADEALKKWFPEHKPVLTGIGVSKLALEGMRVEVEAWADVNE